MTLLRELAESLTKPARRLLLRDGEELRRANARTRAFIDKFRLPNPLRALHASAYKTTRVGTKPSDRRLLPEERAAVEELRFHFSGEYESAHIRCDRWIGPDGAIVIECSENGRFISTLFENDHRISMWPDLPDGKSELFPTTDFLISSDDLLDDYRRMLEKAADYLESTPTHLLHRHEDAQLDLDCIAFYLRHQTPLKWVRAAMSSRLWTTVGENLPTLAGDNWGPETRELVASFSHVGRITDETIAVSCRSCDAAVHVAFDQVGNPTRCTACNKQVSTTGCVLPVHDSSAMQRLLNAATLPAVVCFWSPESWTSALVGAGVLHDASLRGGDGFISLLVDVTVMNEVARRYAVDDVPTFIRFEDGRESGRHVGPSTVDGVQAFANSSAS